MDHLAAIVLAAALCCLSSTASAQTSNEDVQIWTFATVKAPVTGRIDASVDLHLGLIDDASKANQFLVRGIVSYKLDKSFSIGGGYTFVSYHDPSIVSFDEHRITQELSFRSTAEQSRPVLTLRPRLEERFRQGEDGVSVRLRHLTRVDLPISAKGFKLIGWNETFYVVNSTGWAQGHRFDVMLNFIGVGVPLTKKITLEPGYVNFTIFTPNGRDRVNRVFGLFVAASL